MNSKKFFDWCRTAVSSIKHWPQKDEIHRELYNHLEDRYTSLRESGFSHEESEEKALSIMGDAKEVAAQLEKSYKPIWPSLLIITRFMLVICLLISICFAHTKLSLQDLRFSEVLLMNQDDIAFSLKPNVTCCSDGYTFTIKRASYQIRDYQNRAINELWLEFTISHPSIWLAKPDMENALWAVDSEGTYYVNYHDRPNNEKHFVNERGYEQHTGLCDYTKSIVIHNIPAERLEWVDLHYDRDGRDLVWRINLRGGGEQ